jgi:hypothetical protein
MNRWKVSMPGGEQIVEATDLAMTGNSDLVFTLVDLVVLVFPSGTWTGCELVAVNDTVKGNQWLAQTWIRNRAESTRQDRHAIR